jgi:restriction system protein
MHHERSDLLCACVVLGVVEAITGRSKIMSNFKKMAEARMAKTGESWSSASRYVREQGQGRGRPEGEDAEKKEAGGGLRGIATASFEARHVGGVTGVATANFEARADVGSGLAGVGRVTFEARQVLGGLGGIPDTSAFGAGVLREVPPPPPLPGMLLKAELLLFGDKTKEGQLVEATGIPWFEIVDFLSRDERAAYEIDPRKWEEIIAGAWKHAGYQVELTPRSGDGGCDVIATLDGVGSVRIYDEVKAYAPENTVPAEVVRAAAGVLTFRPNVSKMVITTTSTFAPGIAKDESIQRLIPYRLELKPRDVLFPWLQGIAAKRPRK